MSAAILIRRALEARPMSSAELVVALGMKPKTLFCTITRMRDAEPRQLYITGWTRDKGRPRPIYANGDLEDKPQPKPITQHQKAKREWRTVKADPERYIKRLKARRARAIAAKGAMHDPALAALFGRSEIQQEAA